MALSCRWRSRPQHHERTAFFGAHQVAGVALSMICRWTPLHCVHVNLANRGPNHGNGATILGSRSLSVVLFEVNGASHFESLIPGRSTYFSVSLVSSNPIPTIRGISSFGNSSPIGT